MTTRLFPFASMLLASVAMLVGCGTSPIGGFGDASAPLAAPADGQFGPPAPQSAATEAQQLVRDIEEADIVKVVGGKLYALNRYKGLLIIDVADPDAPALLATLDLRGRGVEMYVSGERVFVLLSADFFYAAEGGPAGAVSIAPGPAPQPPEFTGSQLAIVNIASPASPALLGKINLVGFATDSRRVGDIIYVVGGGGPFYFMRHEGDTSLFDGFVASINVSDPNNIIPVERETFSGRGLEMHVSQTAIFAAGQDYDQNSGGSITNVQTIDISDPAGAISLRGAFDVPGQIRNRFYMDDYQSVFRIVTRTDGFGFSQVRLYTYSLADLDHVAPLGQTTIIQGESLEAVRFDGPRGYAVTFLRVDPLFVLDLSDPADPKVAGQLEVPGFSTHIEPRGNRLIAVGIDDTDGQRPAVAYYNVEDPANPTQLSRVVLGPPGSYTESEAVWDEKAFKVIDELGLIVIPFKHVAFGAGQPVPLGEPTASEFVRPECTNGVQLVDFSDTALTQRGIFEHEGRVERVGVIGERVFALSQVGLQTVDITDRSNPAQRGMLEFFNDAERPQYADDCFGYFGGGVIDPGFGVPFSMIEALLRMLSAGGMCGAVGVLPFAILPVGLWLMRNRSRRGR